jgi:hypothetical protein
VDAAFIVDTDVKGGAPVDGGTAVRNTEYIHNLGAWSPAAKDAVAAAVSGAVAEPPQMYMTQCPHQHRDIDPSKTVYSFSAPRSHPDMCYRNLGITQMLHLIQGKRGIYFCSNYAVPGNGHDLSFTGGVAVAAAIGADYPFEDEPDAKRDFQLLRKFMNI